MPCRSTVRPSSLLRIRDFSLAVLMCLLASPAAAFDVATVVTHDMPVPGSAETFTWVTSTAIEGDTVLFTKRMGHATATYRSTGGSIDRLVDATYPAPGYEFRESRDWDVDSGAELVVWGQGIGADLGGTFVTLVANTSTRPEGGTFSNGFHSGVLDGNRVYFAHKASSESPVLYRWEAGVVTIEATLTDLGLPTEFDWSMTVVVADAGNVVIHASFSSGTPPLVTGAGASHLWSGGVSTELAVIVCQFGACSGALGTEFAIEGTSVVWRQSDGLRAHIAGQSSWLLEVGDPLPEGGTLSLVEGPIDIDAGIVRFVGRGSIEPTRSKLFADLGSGFVTMAHESFFSEPSHFFDSLGNQIEAAWFKAIDGESLLLSGRLVTASDAGDIGLYIAHVVDECGNDFTQGDEICDGSDDAACPGACTETCTCPAPPVPVSSSGGVFVLFATLVTTVAFVAIKRDAAHSGLFSR